MSGFFLESIEETHARYWPSIARLVSSHLRVAANNTRRQIMNNMRNNEAIVCDLKASKTWHAQFLVVIGLMPPGLCLHYAASGAFRAYVAHTSQRDWKVVGAGRDHINVSHQTTLIKI